VHAQEGQVRLEKLSGKPSVDDSLEA
jgi:hypothetical protein